MMSRSQTRIQAYRAYGFVLATFAILTIILTWPLARHVSDAIPGDSFDGWQNLWNLWWVKVALLEQHASPYFTNLLYHPTGVSLWFQTLNIFNGLTFLPVQLAGGVFWAYNAVVVFSFVIAGFGAYLLSLDALNRLGARRPLHMHIAALVAGLIFTFSPFHFAHLLGHMQVFSFEFIPFFALYLLKSLTIAPHFRKAHRFGPSRYSLMAALFLILSALCDWYFALYLGFFAGLYVFWLVVRKRIRWAHVVQLLWIFGLALLAVSPLLIPMVRESLKYDFMKPPPGQIVSLSGDITGFFIPSGLHPLWGDWAARVRAPLNASPSENTIYLGLVTAILILMALWRWRKQVGFWVLALLTFAIFALGPVLHIYGKETGIPMPYALILKLPFVEIARTVARYDLLVMLAAGVLASAGLYAWLTRASSRTQTWSYAFLAVALILLDFAPTPYPISPPDTPDFYRSLATDPREGAVMNLPMNWDRPGYLLYQTVHGKPLTAAYITRTDPRTLPGRVPVINRFRHLQEDINRVDDVAMWAPTIFEFMDIQWVVLDRYKMPPGQTRDYTEALAQAIFANQSPAYQDERLTVFETTPPTTRLPFVEIGWDFGPLQPGPMRTVEQTATIILHAPHPGTYQVTIAPVETNRVPWQLEDHSGQIYLRSEDGGPRTLVANLAQTTTSWTIRAMAPGLQIQRIQLSEEDIATSSLFKTSANVQQP